MSENSNINYHLKELGIARNLESPQRVMPDFTENDRAILDIGCGIGQTIVASNLGGDRLLVGIDPDLECLVYGNAQFDGINFINGTAESLPFKADSFDMVFSRVALPYTNIPNSLLEIERVLHNNGKVWLLLHPFSMAIKGLKDAVVKLSFKKIILQIYVLGNGIYFHLFGKVFAFPLLRRFESFQSITGIRRAMAKAGFENIIISRGIHILVTAQKRSVAK